jgi:hypothetical protein
VIGNCANPNCSRPFRYLSRGRVYLAYVPDASCPNARRREHFWLCEQCVKRYTIAMNSSKGAVCVDRRFNSAAGAVDRLSSSSEQPTQHSREVYHCRLVPLVTSTYAIQQ